MTEYMQIPNNKGVGAPAPGFRPTAPEAAALSN